MNDVDVDIFLIYLKRTLVATFCCPICRSNVKVSSPWACHLVVVVELACLNEPIAMPAGVLSPVNLNMPDWSRVRGQTKDSPWSSRLGVWCGANHPAL